MAKHIFDIVAELAKDHPFLIIGMTVLMCILSGIAAQDINQEWGYEMLFEEDDPIWKDFQEYSQNFGSGDNTVFIIIRDKDVVLPSTFNMMIDLGDQLTRLDRVNSVFSPAHLIVEMYGEIPDDKAVLEKILEEMGPSLVPRRDFAIMTLSLDGNLPDSTALAKEIETTVNEFRKPPGVAVFASGNIMLMYQVFDAMGSSMMIMMITAIALMLGILYLVHSRSVRGRLMPFMPLLIAIITLIMVYGVIAVAGISMSPMTQAFLPLVIGLSIEYGVQIQARYEEERARGRTPNEAINKAIRNTGVAVLLAMITTVIGFSSMFFGGVPALAEFGFTVAIGLVICMTLTVTLMLALLKLVDRNRKNKKPSRRKTDNRDIFSMFFDKCTSITGRYPHILIAVMVVLILAGSYGYTRVELETDPDQFNPQDLPAMKRFTELQNLRGATGDTLVFYIRDYDVSSPLTLDRLDRLGRYVSQHEKKVKGFNSLSQVVKNANGGVIPSDRVLIDNIIERGGAGYMSGNTKTVINFPLEEMMIDEIGPFIDAVEKDVRFANTKLDVTITGGPVIGDSMLDRMLSGQLRMTLISFFLVFIALLVIYRSPSKAIIPLISIGAVITFVGGAMYAMGIKHTMISIAMGSVILGVGIDFSIHITERYHEERRNGLDPVSAMKVTVERIGKAITTSALTTAGGFAAMMTSDFPMINEFGFIAFISIIFSLLASLFILPSLFLIKDKYILKA